MAAKIRAGAGRPLIYLSLDRRFFLFVPAPCALVACR